jgi:hypothetical protein
MLCRQLKLGQEGLLQGCQALCDEVSRMLFASLRGLKEPPDEE